MSLLVGILLLVAQDPQEARRSERLAIPSSQIRIHSAILPAVTRYQDCLVQSQRNRPIEADRILVMMEEGIRQCAEERVASMAQADGLLSALDEWSDAALRRQAIEAAFFELDASHRYAGRQVVERTRQFGVSQSATPQDQ